MGALTYKNPAIWFSQADVFAPWARGKSWPALSHHSNRFHHARIPKAWRSSDKHSIRNWQAPRRMNPGPLVDSGWR